MTTKKEIIAIQDCQDGRELIVKIGNATVTENGDIVFELPYPFPTNFRFKIVGVNTEQKEDCVYGQE